MPKGISGWITGFILVIAQAGQGAQAQSQGTGGLPDPQSIYPLVTLDISVEQSLRVFAKTLRVRLILDSEFDGEAMVLQPDGLTRFEYIETIAQDHDLVWYFDGLVLRVASVQAIETRVMEAGGTNGFEVLQILKNLGLLQEKFLHRVDARHGVIRVSGPASYLDVIEEAVSNLTAAENSEVRVLRGSSGVGQASLPPLTQGPAGGF